MTPLLGFALFVLVAGSVVDAYLLLRSIFLRLPQPMAAEPDAPVPDSLRAVHLAASEAGFAYLGLLALPPASGSAPVPGGTAPDAAPGSDTAPAAAFVDGSGGIAALLTARTGTFVSFRIDGGYAKTSWPRAPLFRSVRAGRIVAQSARDLGDGLARHRAVLATVGASPARPVGDIRDLRALVAATAPLARRQLRAVVAMAATSTALATACLIADFATRH